MSPHPQLISFSTDSYKFFGAPDYVPGMFPGARNTKSTEQCLCLHEAHILMGKTDSKSVIRQGEKQL